jgi:hypothetical protein
LELAFSLAKALLGGAWPPSASDRGVEHIMKQRSRGAASDLFAQVSSEFIRMRLPALARRLRVGKPTALGHAVLIWNWVRDRKSGLVLGTDPSAILEGVAEWGGKRGTLVEAFTDPELHLLEWRDTGLWVVGSERYERIRERNRVRQVAKRERDELLSRAAVVTTPGAHRGSHPPPDLSAHGSNENADPSRVTAPQTRLDTFTASQSVEEGPSAALLALQITPPNAPPPPELVEKWLVALEALKGGFLPDGSMDVSWARQQATKVFSSLVPIGQTEGSELLLACQDDAEATWAREVGGEVLAPFLGQAGLPGVAFCAVPRRHQLREISTLAHWVAAAMVVRAGAGLPPCSWHHARLREWWDWASARYGGQVALDAYAAWSRDPTWKRGERLLHHWLSRDAQTGEWKVCGERLEEAFARAAAA